MRYEAVQGHDSIYQGRMILLGIGVAYLTLWLMEFFTFPVMLVPGALADKSLTLFYELAGMVVQYGFLSACWLMVWAGVGWARYVLGLFLLMAGTINIIVSTLMPANGGVVLVLGAISLVSAAGLLSLNVERYIEDRKRKGLPGLGIGLCIVGLFSILLGVAAIQLVQTWMMAQTDQRERAFASDVLGKLIPTLDPGVLDPVASDQFKEDAAASDLAGQFAQVKEQLGGFRDWPGLPPTSIESLVLTPERHGKQVAFNTVAHYEKGDLMLELHVETTKQPMEVVAVFFEKVEPKDAK